MQWQWPTYAGLSRLMQYPARDDFGACIRNCDIRDTIVRIFAMRRREYEGRSQSTGQEQHASDHMIMHQAIAPHSDHSISIFESLTIPIKYTCISYKSPWVSSST
jgi:hypothetical protein